MIVFVGYLAIIVSAISLTPQILQMYKTKKVEDINIHFLIIAILGDILYLVYGISIYEIVFISSMIAPTFSHFIMMFLWFKYKKKNTIENMNTIENVNTIENTITNHPLDIII
jgi:MtN3 and saliva related transmembrane protein